MRTTLNLPDKLISEVQKVTNSKTKTDAIIYALQYVIKHEKMQKLKSYKGRVKLDIDLDALRDR